MKGAVTTDDKYSALKAKLTLLNDSDDDVKKTKSISIPLVNKTRP
jgi:hypothetical protein